MAKKTKALAAVEQIDTMIRTIRGTRVMLDRDLAQIYGVATKAFNQAVKRNAARFPEECFDSPKKKPKQSGFHGHKL